MDLAFIKDTELRNRIKNAIEYIYALYEESKSDYQHKTYRQETYRVIILYVVSTIEAILLYFYKTRGEKIEYVEYKYIHTLPVEYRHSQKSTFPVVVAIQEKIEKEEHQIGLHDLALFFKKKKLIQEKTVNAILEINDVRNTFHFSKKSVEHCDIEQVEKALSLLLRTIEKAPSALAKKSK